MFSLHGFDGCSVKQIADAAGVNVSLINRYFGGKEGLLVSVTKRLIEQKQQAALGYPPQPTLREEIYEYLKFRLRVDIANDQLNRILVSKAAVDRRFRDRIMEMAPTGADQNMRNRLVRLQNQGRVPTDLNMDQVFTAISHFSFSANFLGHSIMGRSRQATLRDFEAFARVYADGIAVQQRS